MSLIVLAALAVLFAWVIPVVILMRRIRRLERRVELVEANAARGASVAPAEHRSEAATPASPWVHSRPVRSTPAEPTPTQQAPPPIPEAAPVSAADVASDAASDATASEPAYDIEPPAGGQAEERWVRSWLVWLGAGTFALGGVLLVKLAADRGFFGPGMRILLGIAVGMALLVLGEWLRRRPGEREAVARRSSFVAPALAASGLATLFAAIWAAWALYDFLPPLLAFSLMAGLSALAMLMSFQHGLFLAILGLVGGLAVPLLVQTGSASAPGLFTYLALLITGALAVAHWMPWRTLLYLIAPATLFWPFLWVVFEWSTGDEMAVGGFLLLVQLLATGLPLAGEQRTVPRAFWSAARITMGLCVVTAWLFIAPTTGFSDAAMIMGIAVGVLAVLVTRFRAYPGLTASPGLLVPLLTLLLFQLGPLEWIAYGGQVAEPDPLNFEQGVLRPADGDAFELWCWATALVIGVTAALLVRRAASPGLMATISGLVPLLVLAIAYLRLADLGLGDRGIVEPAWGILAGLLGLVMLACAHMSARAGPAYRGALSAYVAITAAAIASGAMMLLEHGWLPGALCAEALALALLWWRLRVKMLLRMVPWLTSVAAAVAVMAPETSGLGDPRAVMSITAIVTGLFLPMALCLATRRALLRRYAGLARITIIVEAAALVFWLLGIAHLAQSAAAGLGTGALGEIGIQLTAWLATALGLLRRGPVAGLRGLAIMVLWALAAVYGGGRALTDAFPLVSGEPVGSWPILNSLLPAYGLPALLLAGHAWVLHRRGQRFGSSITGVLGLLAGLSWAALEIRHLFHGPVLTGRTFEPELYSYSLLLIATAVGLLAAGLGRNSLALRRAGLAVLAAAILKVFLVDLDELEGALRAFSFMGLGLSMIGTGYAFQRWGRRSGDSGTAEAGAVS